MWIFSLWHLLFKSLFNYPVMVKIIIPCDTLDTENQWLINSVLNNSPILKILNLGIWENAHKLKLMYIKLELLANNLLMKCRPPLNWIPHWCWSSVLLVLPVILIWHSACCLSNLSLANCRGMALSISNFLLSGAAVRHCDEERGWMEPDLFNCTSPAFKELSALVCFLLDRFR